MIIPIMIPMKVSASKQVIPMSVSASQQVIPMSISAHYEAVNVPAYDGAYEVTPRLYPQYLDTDGKLMTDDVSVYEIPISRTTNPTGGLTVLIG